MQEIERCCGNCANAIDFAEQYFDGSPVTEPEFRPSRLTVLSLKTCGSGIL